MRSLLVSEARNCIPVIFFPVFCPLLLFFTSAMQAQLNVCTTYVAMRRLRLAYLPIELQNIHLAQLHARLHYSGQFGEELISVFGNTR